VTFSWGPIWTIGAFNLRIADILLVLLAGLFVGKWAMAGALPIGVRTLRDRPILVMLVLFSLWTLTSLFVTVIPALTVRRIVRVWLLLIMTVGICDLRPSFRWMVNLFSLHILAQSTIAIGQAILQRDLGLSWLGEQEQMAKLGYNVLDAGGRLILRVQGIAEHPNLLGITLVVPLLVIFVYLLFPNSQMHSLWRGEAVLPVAALMMGVVALFFTFSRAATLGGMIALGLLFIVVKWGTIWDGHERATLIFSRIAVPGKIVFLGIGILLFGMLLFAYQDVVFSRLDLQGSLLERTSVTERAVQNRVGWSMVQASPFVGVGAHSARERFTEFLGSETRISHTIHNTVLLISAELGIPAGLLWLSLLVIPPSYALRHRHALSIPALAFSIALTPYLITNFTSPASYDTPVGSLLHWLLLALWLETTTTTS
jgi:hypothetical protein